MSHKNPFLLLSVAALVALTGCAPSSQPIAGPDKQFSSGSQGALVGAGAGAATGFQLTAVTGPGAVIGAGIGAIAGGLQGAKEDSIEEKQLQLSKRARIDYNQTAVLGILNDHYNQRLALHPTRDIFAADLFFQGDSTKLSRQGAALARELARLNRNRLPWSRLVVATYVKSNDPHSEYAAQLAKKRAIDIANIFIKYGIEPRRIETRPVIMNQPVLIDPQDRADRYNQAVEFIAEDR